MIPILMIPIFESYIKIPLIPILMIPIYPLYAINPTESFQDTSTVLPPAPAPAPVLSGPPRDGAVEKRAVV